MHMWEWGFGGGWIFMIFIWLIIIAVIAAVIILVINSVKQTQGSSPHIDSGHSAAVEKVKERYAKGEIDREEYKQMMEDLKD